MRRWCEGLGRGGRPADATGGEERKWAAAGAMGNVGGGGEAWVSGTADGFATRPTAWPCLSDVSKLNHAATQAPPDPGEILSWVLT